MPVENIYADGTIMYNVNVKGKLSESHYSFFGDVLEDELVPDIAKSAKEGKEQYWRYLTADEAKTRQRHQEELLALQTAHGGTPVGSSAPTVAA